MFDRGEKKVWQEKKITTHIWEGGELTAGELREIVDQINSKGIPDDARIQASTGWGGEYYYTIEAVIEDAWS